MTTSAPVQATTMKAISHRRYGPPDVLELVDVPIPTVADDRVLVRVRAASVNALDWHLLRGKPYLARLTGGLRAPKSSLRGVDLAGEVEAVGRAVTTFRPGDAVFGSSVGAFAEFVAAREDELAPKPVATTFEAAAAVPTAGFTALQGLRDKGRIQRGQRVLIHGAGGGVGTFAVQIAKALGAEVSAVSSTRNVDMLRSLGADQVIDYTREDFTKGTTRYDLIFDIGADRPLSDCRRVLTPDGTLVMVGPGRGDWIGPVTRIVRAMVTTRTSSQRVLPFLADDEHADLVTLRDWLEAGTIQPVICRSFPLSSTAEAIRHVEEGHAQGKVVITV